MPLVAIPLVPPGPLAFGNRTTFEAISFQSLPAVPHTWVLDSYHVHGTDGTAVSVCLPWLPEARAVAPGTMTDERTLVVPPADGMFTGVGWDLGVQVPPRVVSVQTTGVFDALTLYLRVQYT